MKVQNIADLFVNKFICEIVLNLGYEYNYGEQLL